MNFLIKVSGLVEQETDLQYEDFEKGTLGPHLDAHLIVPIFTGKAIPFSSFIERIRPLNACTHVVFHASDEFQAVIPLQELQDALLLFQQPDGQKLKKGFPVRLIVPNGSSDCLNVKSVVHIEFIRREEDTPASFGFKNLVDPREL
jgi:DMSO/TMAO reductase YedYZ molybdopterin-dependent catalytic subunit